MKKTSFIYKTMRSVYHRSKNAKQIKANYKRNVKNWGKDYALINFDYEKAMNSICSKRKKQNYFDIKSEYIIDFLKKNTIPYLKIEEYRHFKFDDKEIPKIIWIYWWDGFANAPQIVKACVSSIHKCAGNAKVIEIDKDNYKEYVKLPPEIEQKHEIGIIGQAHFSDIVRLSLLSEYGGLWMDATLYCSKVIPESVWQGKLYTCKQQRDTMVPSQLRWAGWLIGGVPDFPLFPFARDALIAYWKRYDTVIDYLLMDYVFDLAYQLIDEVKETIDNLPPNNPDRHELMKIIDKPYKSEFFDNKTFVYKLSYRYGKLQMMNEGQMTFYAFIVDGGSL